MSLSDMQGCLAAVGDAIEDATEEMFLLFSQDLPSNDLGMYDPHAPQIELDVAGRSYVIKQSPGLLRSERGGGTTGAALWKVTPLIADWLSDRTSVLWSAHVLKATSTVVELGCGIAGLIGLAMHSTVEKYILTDQPYVMRLLRENISLNISQTTRKRSRPGHTPVTDNTGPSDLELLTLDWEHDSVTTLTQSLRPDAHVELVVICDCIYNTYLIPPLLQTCIELCSAGSASLAVVLTAQQLRSDSVFEEWLSVWLQHFYIWRIHDHLLPPSLQSSSGYVIHVSVLRSRPETE